ncbi:hypothetical protein HDF22_001410 [Mucilaginibacter lappiensis]|uniref:Uncharacterized protein n=1 Tax=Mucilaginibacter lappiensis TaxID=354630 RepID=A0A841J9B3_9SPHI|nr:hypothetical protein [Mucilaginibacter lappiensis]
MYSWPARCLYDKNIKLYLKINQTLKDILLIINLYYTYNIKLYQYM